MGKMRTALSAIKGDKIIKCKTVKKKKETRWLNVRQHKQKIWITATTTFLPLIYRLLVLDSIQKQFDGVKIFAVKPSAI